MQGIAMGIEHSLFAFSYVIGPILGIKIYSVGGIAGLSIVCGVIFCATLYIWTTYVKSESDLKEEKID
jgi:hypothetical protein